MKKYKAYITKITDIHQNGAYRFLAILFNNEFVTNVVLDSYVKSIDTAKTVNDESLLNNQIKYGHK